MADEHTLFVRPPVWALFIAVVIGGGFYVWGKHIEVRDDERATISVSGEGKIFVTPDIAQLSFGVATGRQKTAAAALATLETQITAAHDAVVKLGVDPKDIRTENFWLNPVYDWTQDKGQIFRGFEANQSLRVKVRDLDMVSAVLEAATVSGANQAGGIEFTVDEPEAKRAEARRKAIDQAEQKAAAIASDLGVDLGDLTGFNEGGNAWGGPVMMRAEAMDMGGGMGGEATPSNIPLPPGEQEIFVSVTLTYELD